MPTEYLKRILTSKVYEIATESPLVLANELSQRLKNSIYIKCEDTQAVFSFKIRGAYNKMANLTQEAMARGVICASAGNHAQGFALSARHLGCKGMVVMPITAPTVKIEAVKRLGAQVILHGDSFSDAYQYSKELEKKHGYTFVHPFDDPDVIAGQGTIAMEILRQHSGPIDAIFVSIGGGGLAAGVATYVKQLRPEIKIIGVQTYDSNCMQQSVEAGHIVELADVGLFSDGTAVKRVGDETFRLCQQYLDGFINVTTDEICAAIRDVFQNSRTVLEPAGAMALAGLKRYIHNKNAEGETLIAVASGANMNFDRLGFVAERAEVGEAREALFAVTMPEERGSFRRFCELIGPRNVTEFNYRMGNDQQAHVFVGVQLNNPDASSELTHAFESHGFKSVNLSNDELAKSHLRHMVGGRSAQATDELLYRFEFPERPGALMRFLNSMQADWNISLFHYRNHGADYGQILIGIQVPPYEHDKFKTWLEQTGYTHADETANPAYQLFLK